MSLVDGLNPYWLMAVAGFFTGLGNIVGQWVYKKFIEPRIDRIHKKIRGKKK